MSPHASFWTSMRSTANSSQTAVNGATALGGREVGRLDDSVATLLAVLRATFSAGVSLRAGLPFRPFSHVCCLDLRSSLE